MPQIAQIAATYASQIFWMLVIFAIIYFAIGNGMVPKIEATVDARDRRIADDLAAAHSARAAADATEDAYRTRMDAARNNARIETERTKADAVLAAEARVKAADAELSAKADVAEADLRAVTDRALAGIEGVAADAARDIVLRLSGAEVAPDDATRAVRSALAA
ncbi:ATPase [Sphingomonas montana]|uniref:F0F1 ATP synthase subunit B family protein n=1 Tax=Sphingomonas montana TaxID=1843236 RepID=UPI00096BE413|nr:ATPase [Sphingomonas montana]